MEFIEGLCQRNLRAKVELVDRIPSPAVLRTVTSPTRERGNVPPHPNLQQMQEQIPPLLVKNALLKKASCKFC
jgi:hypothetical protein